MVAPDAGPTKMSTGQFREFAGAVLRALPDDLDDETVAQWIENQDALREAIRDMLLLSNRARTYPVTVNYDLLVKDAVKLGHYGQVNSDITSEHFPTKRKGMAMVVITLIFPNQRSSTEGMLKEFDRIGFRPAELHELLAFGAKYPDIQQEGFPVVALGSIWQDRNGRDRVPCLHNRSGGNNWDVYLYWGGQGWGELCRFAVIRSESHPLDLPF